MAVQCSAVCRDIFMIIDLVSERGGQLDDAFAGDARQDGSAELRGGNDTAL